MGKIAPLAIALALTGVIAVGSFIALSTRTDMSEAAGGTGSTVDPAALEPEPGWEGIKIPEFALIDQQGRSVNQSALEGKVSVVDFIFTHCPLQCPAMTGQMWDISQKLKGAGVQFVSFSIDPATDRPARLREYAGGYDIPGWMLLTEQETPVQHVARSILSDEIGFLVRDLEGDTIETPAGEILNIQHPTKIFLVGPERQILATAEFAIQEQVDMMIERARAAARAIR